MAGDAVEAVVTDKVIESIMMVPTIPCLKMNTLKAKEEEEINIMINLRWSVIGVINFDTISLNVIPSF